MSEEQTFYRVSSPTGLSYRSEGGKGIVEGVVVPYNTWTEVDEVFEGHFLERFAPGALKKSFMERSRKLVKGYYEHGRSKAFGSAPIMDITDTWENDQGAFFRAELLDGLPEFMLDGIRKGLYGASLGARAVQSVRDRFPKPSSYNPKGLMEVTRKEVNAYDISLTPTPIYEGATVLMRAITDELAVEQLVQNPEKLLQLIRQASEAEPPHSPPEGEEAELPQPAEDPERIEEIEPEEKPEEEEPEPDPKPEGSRDTQPPKDYLSDEEEAWRL